MADPTQDFAAGEVRDGSPDTDRLLDQLSAEQFQKWYLERQ